MTPQLLSTWKPEIDAYIQDEAGKEPKSLYKQMFDVKNTNRLQITDVDYAGFSPMMPVADLGDAVEDNAVEGYKNLYQPQAFRKSVTFSSDLLETDLTGEVEKMARSLPKSVEYSRDLTIFSSWRRAFDTLLTYGDGKPLASIAHPTKAGYTNANTYADGVQRALTYDNVLALQDVLIATTSNAGNIMNLGTMGKNKVIWCSPYLREKAFQIAGIGVSGEKPGTTDRETNYFVKGDKFDVLVNPWISYEAARQAGEVGAVTKSSASNYWDTMWGILDLDVYKQFAKVYVRTGYAMYADETTKSNQAYVKYAYDKYAFGFSAPYGFTVSKGDSTTVSA